MLILVSLTLLTLDYHGEANRAITHIRNGFQSAISPIQKGIADILHPVGNLFAGAFNYGSLEQQNVALTKELTGAERQLYEQRGEESQIRQIQALDNIKFASNLPSVDAPVISQPSSNFQYTIEIGEGTSEGIGPGMPVVGLQGYVGTVLTASSSTAVIQLEQDVKTRVGVRFEEKSSGYSLGVIEGQGAGRPLTALVNLPGPKKGSIVYTSGLYGELYPSGLPVGVVTNVHLAPGALQDDVTVTPLVNVNQLQFVRVILWEPPA
jgi:rod shape-determining protein MreC